MPRKLAPYLIDVLCAVAHQAGDDIYFVLGHLHPATARSYMSRLKRRGLAYTHVAGGTTEVWPTTKGITLAQKLSDEHPRHN